MSLVSMKVPDYDSCAPCYPNPNPYGYGLCICLSEEQVEALGLNRNPPAAGSTVNLRAVATVRRVSQEVDSVEPSEGEVEVVLELQITDLEVTQSGAMPMATAASALYSGDND